MTITLLVTLNANGSSVLSVVKLRVERKIEICVSPDHYSIKSDQSNPDAKMPNVKWQSSKGFEGMAVRLRPNSKNL